MPNQAVEARQKQSETSKRATLDLLKSKKRARQTFTLFLSDGEGTMHELQMTFQAIGAVEYDKLVSKHPPKAEQRVDGATYNIDSFAPALISRCSVDPEMSEDDAQEIWQSSEWSRGDLMVLFRNAIELNNRGIDIPFNENG